MRTLIAIAASLLLVGTARAAPEPSAEDQARELFKEGNRRVAARDLAGALEQFEAAYQLFPSEKILLNIGTTQMALGHKAAAANSYQRYLADPDAEPARRAEVQKLIDQLAADLGRLDITVDVARAEITVDGAAVGSASPSLSWYVDPGEHQLVARAAGRPSVVSVATVAAGAEGKVALTIPPAPAPEPATPPPPEPATTRVPPPEVAARSLPPPDPDAAAIMDTTPTPRSGPPAWAPWAATGVAVVAAGTGAFFAQRAADDGTGYDDARDAATGANVSFVIAGAAAVTAGGLWYWRWR